MSFRTDREGNRFPVKPRLTMYYQVMVTHFPEGYDPFTVEYGIAERNMTDAMNKKTQAEHEFPQSKVFILPLRLETSYD